MQAIFLDFGFATTENTEEALWTIHTSINSEYRRILGRLKHSSHAVEKRKVEKSYNNFLRIAQKFYKGYIQRLAARYDVQELKRVAQGIDVEQMTTEDKISPVPSELHTMVLTSCHSTLIRLGDLARYRTQARRKSSGYEIALTYYSLAQHLKPHSGFASHQMGIINLDQGHHLDVVYHFYRAWVVESPHPNARPNLESEFKSLNLPQTAATKPRHNSSAPQDAFTMWFVRLHALFYKGEVFQQQSELEGEVMHRLEMAARSATSPNTLLKMTLVNISAHHIASLKYNGMHHLPPSYDAPPYLSVENRDDDAASRFYQYTLRFNARFILTFCGVLETELRNALSNNGEDLSGDPISTQKTSVIEHLLPVLRMYSIWLGTHRHELFGATAVFGTLIPMMVQGLARTFTLLCVETYKSENLATCPYLLVEDLEMLGLRPLSDDKVPEACRFYYGEGGKLKPYLQEPGHRLDSSGENAARILDILRAAYFLAEDCAVPLTYQVENSRLVFEFQSVAPSSQLPVQSMTVLEDSNTVPENPVNEKSERSPDPMPAPTIQAARAPDTSGIETSKLSAELTNDSNYELSGDADDADNTVINMLAPFLKPPTPQPQQQPASPQESSYGMHTATAHEVFAAIELEPSPTRSIPSGKFEQLPWAWFNTPNPHGARASASSAGKEAFNGQQNATYSPVARVATARLLDDPFATPGRPVSAAFARNISGEISPSGSSAEQAHREQLLQSFTNSSAPRTSNLSQWSQNHVASHQPGPAMSPWGPRGLDLAPFSSAVSGFSHPSSLYQGTPANGAIYGAAGSRHPQRHDTPNRDNGPPSSMHFQMDETTMNYDEAILKAAYHGTR